MSRLKIRIAVLSCMALALGAVIFTSPSTGATSSVALAPVTSPAQLVIGKELYREYCGECHALSAALAAGFGSNNGLGQFGGPSFNNLRVSFSISIQAVTLGFAGHEVVVTKMNWQQLDQVSSYLAQATKINNYPARISDG